MTDKTKDPYVFKQQTPQHQATMKVMCEFLIEEGYTPDDIINAGDYLLDQMSIADMTGEKKDAKQYKQKKGTQAVDSSPAPAAGPKPEKPGKGKPAKSGKSDKPGKKKKGKGKSAKKV